MTFEEYVNQVASALEAIVTTDVNGDRTITKDSVVFSMELSSCTVRAHSSRGNEIKAKMGDPKRFIQRLKEELIPQIIEDNNREIALNAKIAENKIAKEQLKQMIIAAGDGKIVKSE